MSQLDITISFNQFLGLLFCLVIFIYYYNIFLSKYFYNYHIREEDKLIRKRKDGISNSIIIIKKIFQL